MRACVVLPKRPNACLAGSPVPRRRREGRHRERLAQHGGRAGGVAGGARRGCVCGKRRASTSVPGGLGPLMRLVPGRHRSPRKPGCAGCGSGMRLQSRYALWGESAGQRSEGEELRCDNLTNATRAVRQSGERSLFSDGTAGSAYWPGPGAVLGARGSNCGVQGVDFSGRVKAARAISRPGRLPLPTHPPRWTRTCQIHRKELSAGDCRKWELPSASFCV